MKRAILNVVGTGQQQLIGRALTSMVIAILLSLISSSALAQWTVTKPNQSLYYTSNYMEIAWTGGPTGSLDIILQQYNGFWNNVLTIQQYYASGSSGSVLWLIPSGYVGTNYRITVRNNWDWSSASSGTFAIEDELITNTFPSSGNVGVGTLNPNRPLHIVGDIRVTGSIRSGDTVVIDQNRKVAAGNGSAGTPAFHFSSQTNMGMYRAGTNNLNLSVSGASRFQLTNTFLQSNEVHRFSAGSASAPALTFTSDTGVGLFRSGSNIYGFSTAGVERLRVESNGNIGIGISASSQRLAVNGDTKAREAIITEQSGDWPDYVFDSSYELMDLGELEQFVSTHHHLPGVPSRVAVEMQGQAIGGIQQQLLKKIEELTLYVISLSTEQQHLQIEFEELIKQIDSIE